MPTHQLLQSSFKITPHISQCFQASVAVVENPSFPPNPYLHFPPPPHLLIPQNTHNPPSARLKLKLKRTNILQLKCNSTSSGREPHPKFLFGGWNKHGEQKEKPRAQAAPLKNIQFLKIRNRCWECRHWNFLKIRNRRWECRPLKFFKNQKPSLGMPAIEIFLKTGVVNAGLCHLFANALV